jgi:hypothetical protein
MITSASVSAASMTAAFAVLPAAVSASSAETSGDSAAVSSRCWYLRPSTGFAVL